MTPMERVELVWALLQAGSFDRDDWACRRGAASVALAYFCGMGPWAQERLTRGDWRPAGRDVVAFRTPREGPDVFRDRAIPLVPAAMIVVERYLSADPSGDLACPFFRNRDGSAVSQWHLRESFRRAAEVRGTVCTLAHVAQTYDALLSTNNTHDGLAEYLVGARRSLVPAGGYGSTNPPPDDVARRFLMQVLPHTEKVRALWHRSG